MTSPAQRVARGIVLLVGAAVAGAVGWVLFVRVPGRSLARLFGVVLAVGVALGGLRVANNAAETLFGGYDVAEVEVDDVITRDGGGPGPVSPIGVSADDVVEAIEAADEDRNAEALVVKLNTPGGAVVPSEDIRVAAEEFDGPTVAYAEDMATSGGYWIASGCDEVHARRGSIVGSIGVNGTQLGRADLADELGLEYRRFVAGEYKDSLSAQWRELADDEVEYIQGLLNAYYDQFIDTVVEGHDLDAEFARETEARVYLGERAHEVGLVDHCGPRAEMEDRLADRLGLEEIEVREFEPESGLADRLSMGARGIARAFGAGVAGVLVGDDEPPVEAR